MNYRTKHGDDFEILLRDGDIDIYTSHGSSLTVCTPDEADSIAVHLIQASLGEGLDAQDVQYFSSESPESRLKIGLALIRSAK